MRIQDSGATSCAGARMAAADALPNAVRAHPLAEGRRGITK